MSELDYEEPPEVYVPMVRDWVGPALLDWYRGCYPPRRGFFIVWGWLFPIWMLVIAFKFGIFALGVVVIALAFVVWIPAELATYRHRRKRAMLEAWTNYMIDLHDGGDEA